MAENMFVSPSETGVRITKAFSDALIFCGSTFRHGVVGALVEQAIVTYPEFEDEQPHLMAFMAYNPGGKKMVELVLLSTNEKGGKIISYRLSGGEGSVREFTACNAFVNHGPYLSVADIDLGVLYVTMFPEQMAPDWTYKLVSFDFILHYICRQISLKELDEAAESERQTRDELKELRAEAGHLRVMQEADAVLLDTATARAEVAEQERDFYIEEMLALEHAVHKLLGWALEVKAESRLSGWFARIRGLGPKPATIVRAIAEAAHKAKQPHETAEELVSIVDHIGSRCLKNE